jgi:hypothetical protein
LARAWPYVSWKWTAILSTGTKDMDITALSIAATLPETDNITRSGDVLIWTSLGILFK